MDEDIKQVLRYAKNDNYDIALFTNGYGITSRIVGGSVSSDRISEETLEKMFDQNLVTRRPNGNKWNYAFSYEGRRLGAKFYYNL